MIDHELSVQERQVVMHYVPQVLDRTCGNCDNFTMDLVECQRHWTAKRFADRNHRCVLGGFDVLKKGSCNYWTKRPDVPPWLSNANDAEAETHQRAIKETETSVLADLHKDGPRGLRLIELDERGSPLHLMTVLHVLKPWAADIPNYNNLVDRIETALRQRGIDVREL